MNLEDISPLGAELTRSSARNPQSTLRISYYLMEIYQQKLRQKDPRNPLLGLVLLRPDRADYYLADNFRSRISEHLPKVPSNSIPYLLIGFYIELLKSELKNPLFTY